MPLPLSLVVFAYNEASNVPTVLAEILAWLEARGAPFQLLFVDDGSTDGTGDAARAVLGNRPEKPWTSRCCGTNATGASARR